MLNKYPSAIISLHPFGVDSLRDNKRATSAGGVFYFGGTMEEWRDIPGYERIYQVSNMGRIKSLERYDKRGFKKWPTRILKPAKTPNGYYQVLLAKDGKTIKRYVHHIVTDVFLGPCPPGKERNHKNGNKADNSIDNLEYCTPSENHHHSYDMLGKQAARGSKQGSAKLVEEQVIEIRKLHKDGFTARKLSKMFNVSDSQILHIVHRREWKHI